MQVRLAFSIAIRAQSDILLIDEVLAVGDANFQKKCIEVFQDLKRAGKTIIFVSHSMSNIKDFCDRVLVIKEGEAIFDGETAKAVDIYNKLNLDKDVEDNEKYNSKHSGHLGTGGALIKKFEFFDKNGKNVKVLETGEDFTVRLEIDYRSDANDPVVGVMFRRNSTENLYGLDNHSEGVSFGPKRKGDKSVVTINSNMPLSPGEYLVSFSVIDAKSSSEFEDMDIMDNALRISITSDNLSAWGLIRTPAKVKEE
jgi:ABC-type Fe3+/spermidine/putrescine transport system ATPase subunit